MLSELLQGRQVILASNSPRRQQLLNDLDVRFEVLVRPVDEAYPPTLKPEEVAEFLAQKKTQAYEDLMTADTILITADTVVISDGAILGKPTSKAEALDMLQQLSGGTHEVMTGVCLSSVNKTVSFSVSTTVEFDQLTEAEINYYIDTYQPFDKAGSYGIQEWIGYIGIPKIVGSYFNVVGLPVHRLYRALRSF